MERWNSKIIGVYENLHNVIIVGVFKAITSRQGVAWAEMRNIA